MQYLIILRKAGLDTVSGWCADEPADIWQCIDELRDDPAYDSLGFIRECIASDEVDDDYLSEIVALAADASKPDDLWVRLSDGVSGTLDDWQFAIETLVDVYDGHVYAYTVSEGLKMLADHADKNNKYRLEYKIRPALVEALRWADLEDVDVSAILNTLYLHEPVHGWLMDMLGDFEEFARNLPNAQRLSDALDGLDFEEMADRLED